ncbi:MAG: FAD-binding oxidoreductase, partial [Rhodobacteraceae bacterium]|nr:FAD-binding oxidoreductase [Paracoccaceae bacterium]
MSRKTLNEPPDVTVLGAGIVGICSALSLAEKGLRVRLIDRDDPGQATSHGNAGVISPWSVVPQSMP